MLRVQRTSSDRQYQQAQAQQPPPTQQQHVTLAPRPLFLDDNMDDSGGDGYDAMGNVSMSQQLRPQHHHLQQQQQHARLSHSAKARKIRSNGDHHHHSSSMHGTASTPTSSASSNGGTNGLGRKVLKKEVTELQHLVDGMQQQVNAATREIQELRNMVGRMVSETAQQEHELQQEHEHEQQQYKQEPLIDELQSAIEAQQQALAPLMDIYQQHSAPFSPPGLTDAQQTVLAEHFACGLEGAIDDAADADADATDDDGNSSVSAAQHGAFYCRMEQALLCDDHDDYPLFFDN